MLIKIIEKLYMKILIIYENFIDKINKNKCKKVSSREIIFFKESRVHNLSGKRDKIKIGIKTKIRGELLIFNHGGEVKIGDFCYIGENTRIWSAEMIEIGNRVLISHDVNIHDGNDHPLDYKDRHQHYKDIIEKGHPNNIETIKSAPIVIEDDAWIGFGSIILKGVRIGKGSIIAAGSIVTKDVEPWTVVAGNPAKVVKRLR